MVAPGEVLCDKYLVDRVIGHGGMATVVAARHLHLNEQVAIKMLRPELAQDAGIVERFLREARAAVRLKGEHVTRVLDVGILPDGAPFLVMELLVGIDLAELIKARTVLSPPEAADCVLQVCEALAEAHAGGIVHRDIKPSNLFITTRPDGSPLVKVLDFGISKVQFDNQVSNLTQNSVVGTPSYMSPEQLRALPSVDHRTDIWSLGIVLYRLLAGHRPFKADSMSALAIQCATEPTPTLTIPMPPGLDAIVYRCLEKDPALRYQSVAELAYALAPYAGDARAAAMVVDRTRSILRWTPPAPMPMPMPMPVPVAAPVRAPMPAFPVPVPPAEPTTLGSSAAAIYPVLRRSAPPPRKRGWVIGGVAIGVVAITLGIAGLVSRGGSEPAAAAQPAPRGPIVEPIDEASAPTTSDPASDPASAASASPPAAAPAPVAPGSAPAPASTAPVAASTSAAPGSAPAPAPSAARDPAAQPAATSASATAPAPASAAATSSPRASASPRETARTSTSTRASTASTSSSTRAPASSAAAAKPRPRPEAKPAAPTPAAAPEPPAPKPEPKPQRAPSDPLDSRM